MNDPLQKWAWWRRLKEPFSALSHLSGAVLSLVASGLLLLLSRGRPLHLLAFGLYGMGLVFLYGASGLYHALRVPPEKEAVLQRLDHSAIFLLIAGTYAPVCLVPLGGAGGWLLLTAEYLLAAAGIAAVLIRPRRFDLPPRLPHTARVVLYLVMGWLVALAAPTILHALPPAGVGWLIAGGLAYCIGTVIFVSDRPHLLPGRFSAHDLWHLFVLAGSVCHFVMMVYYIAPSGAGSG